MEKEEKNQSKESKPMLAVVRVRGDVNLKHIIRDTFEYMSLLTKNHCVLLKETPSTKGMLQKVKDYVTWGPISPETMSEMAQARGEVVDKDSKHIMISGKPYRNLFKLNSPKKGYGRKGVKFSFAQSGALGSRGDKINDLIKRMI